MDQCLPRKLQNTATSPMSCADRSSDLDFQFSLQPLIAFKPHFVFPDHFDTHNHLKRPKKICSANQRWQLERRVSSPHTLCVSTVFLSYLGNHRSHSSPVSCFRTNSTPAKAYKGRKHSAARIRDGVAATSKLRGRSPLLTLSV